MPEDARLIVITERLKVGHISDASEDLNYVLGLLAARDQQIASLQRLIENWSEQADKHRTSADRYYDVGEQERSGKMDARAQVYLSCAEGLMNALKPNGPADV